MDGPKKSKCKSVRTQKCGSWRSESVKLNGPWILKRGSGRSAAMKVDGSKAWKWTVQNHESGRTLWNASIPILVDEVRTAYFSIFGLSTFSLLDRPLLVFLTIHLLSFGSSTWRFLDRPVSFLWAVLIWLVGPSNFWFQDHPHLRTVHFESFGQSSLIYDRLLSVVWTVQLKPHGLSTLTKDRLLWQQLVFSGRPSTSRTRPRTGTSEDEDV